MLAPAFEIYMFAFIISYTEMQTKPITLYFTESTGRHSNYNQMGLYKVGCSSSDSVNDNTEMKFLSLVSIYGMSVLSFCT